MRLGNNLAWKCIAEMAQLLYPVNFVFNPIGQVLLQSSMFPSSTVHSLPVISTTGILVG